MTEPAFQPVRPSQPVRYTAPANWYQRAVNSVPSSARQVNVPGGLPTFLGNRTVIFAAWGVSMIIIGFDEWHTYHILPRPQRLWLATLLYGLLAVVSQADAVVPVANAFAIGFTFVLLYQLMGGLQPTGPVQSIPIGGGQTVIGTNQTGIIGIGSAGGQ